MSQYPTLNAKQVERALLRLGFKKIRQKGSHVFYKHEDERVTTVPHHTGRDIAYPLLRKILNDIQTSPVEFFKWV
ncbi:MAG: type II toxin-antitoxin system HicA family toxin [Vampirovibrionales bacterium]|nr:type II toxin-antitoxin system HicA family toxin [Vampirovibrionales bacterium]